MNISVYRPAVITLTDETGDILLKYETETDKFTGVTYTFASKAELISELEQFIEEIRKA